MQISATKECQSLKANLTLDYAQQNFSLLECILTKYQKLVATSHVDKFYLYWYIRDKSSKRFAYKQHYILSSWAHDVCLSLGEDTRECAATLLGTIYWYVQNKESAFNSSEYHTSTFQQKSKHWRQAAVAQKTLQFPLWIIKVIPKALRLIQSFVCTSILVVKVCQL